LFDAAMILFDERMKVVVTLVNDILAKRFADGTWRGTRSIGCDVLRCVTHSLNGLLEKALCCLPIPFLTQQ